MSDARPPIVAGARRVVRQTALWAGILGLAVRHSGSLRQGLAGTLGVARERDRWRGTTLPKKLVRGPDGRHFVSLHVPGFPSRALDRLVEGMLDKKRGALRTPLVSMIWAITTRCPLRCSHCSEIDLLGRAEAVSDEGLLAILAALRARGVVQLQLSGGEPLERLDMLERISREVSHETEVWVLTSGMGLDDRVAGRLRAAGVTGVNVSLDHWDPAAHDLFRRRTGVHAAVVAGLEAARRSGLVTAVTLTLTRETADRAFLARYLEAAASLGVGFVRWLEPRAVGHWDGQSVDLSPQQRAAVDAAYREANGGHPDLPIVDFPDGDRRHGGCRGAGASWAFVDGWGRLHACPFCRDPVADVVAGGLEPGLAALAHQGCHLAPPAPARAGPLPVLTSAG